MLRALALLAVLLATAASTARARSTGIDSSAYYPPVGCGGADGQEVGCHFTVANPALTVTLQGPPSIDPGAGGSAAYTASAPVGFQELFGAGVNIRIGPESTSDCQLDNLGSPILQPDGNVLTHVGTPLQNLVGVWSYDFLLVNCTVPGTVVLYAAMNAFDGFGDESGEVWNGIQTAIVVPEPGAWGAAGAALVLGALAWRRAGRTRFEVELAATPAA